VTEVHSNSQNTAQHKAQGTKYGHCRLYIAQT